MSDIRRLRIHTRGVDSQNAFSVRSGTVADGVCFVSGGWLCRTSGFRAPQRIDDLSILPLTDGMGQSRDILLVSGLEVTPVTAQGDLSGLVAHRQVTCHPLWPRHQLGPR